jgi:hypothetical protein
MSEAKTDVKIEVNVGSTVSGVSGGGASVAGNDDDQDHTPSPIVVAIKNILIVTPLKIILGLLFCTIELVLFIVTLQVSVSLSLSLLSERIFSLFCSTSNFIHLF